jgi:hypothetical protein
MLKLIATKNLIQNQKIEILTKNNQRKNSHILKYTKRRNKKIHHTLQQRRTIQLPLRRQKHHVKRTLQNEKRRTNKIPQNTFEIIITL